VHSSILRLVPSSLLAPAERRAVLEVARAAFQMRRKTLRHGITRAAGGDAALAAAALQAAGLDAGRRPGTLDLDEWRALAGALAARRPSAPR
jgi:16S rRNA (adenine1518-N6/adenine1519-N6)-dimethyltransferase